MPSPIKKLWGPRRAAAGPAGATGAAAAGPAADGAAGRRHDRGGDDPRSDQPLTAGDVNEAAAAHMCRPCVYVGYGGLGISIRKGDLGMGTGVRIGGIIWRAQRRVKRQMNRSTRWVLFFFRLWIPLSVYMSCPHDRSPTNRPSLRLCSGAPTNTSKRRVPVRDRPPHVFTPAP